MTEQEWLDIFGDNLVGILEEYGYSQKEFADECRLSESTISKYVHKKQLPNLKAIVNMAYVLDMDINELIDFDDMIE